MVLKKIVAAALTSGMLLSFVPATVIADSSSWVHDIYGWRYYREGQGYVRNDWVEDAGKWYFCYENGYMISDVENYLIDGVFYSFDASGACKNPDEAKRKLYGFQKGNYIPYYYPAGVLEYCPCTYYFEPDGKFARGWLTIDGNWYFFDKDTGVMADLNGSDRIPYNIDGAYYYFDKDGVMITGWYFDGFNWFYGDATGKLFVEKWLCNGGNWYYFDANGYMISDCKYYAIKGIEYDFDENGVCVNPYATSNSQHGYGWFSKYDPTYNGIRWYYYDDDGSMHKGWLSKSGYWYYMDPDNGAMVNDCRYIDGKYYYFCSSGEMVTGWYEDINGWRYCGSDGAVIFSRWICDNDNWFYVDVRGYRVSECENYSIDEIDYDFDPEGICLNPDAEYERFYGWHKRTVYGNVYWYYYGDNGYECHNIWVCDAGNWYYIGGDYKMVHSIYNYYIEGRYYDFDRNGICLNPYSGRDAA